MKRLSARLIAGAALVTAMGISQVAGAQGWSAMNDWVSRLGTARIEKADPTMRVSLDLWKASIDQAIEQKRLEAMKRPEVIKAYEAAQAASLEFKKQRLANPEYADLLSRQKELRAKMTPPSFRDHRGDPKAFRAKRREYARNVGTLSEEFWQTNYRLVELTNTDEKLKAYKAKEDEAWIAAMAAVKAVLAADKEMQQLQADRKTIEEAQKVMREDNMRHAAERSRRFMEERKRQVEEKATNDTKGENEQ